VLIVLSIVLGALYAYGASLDEGDLAATELIVTPTIDGQVTGDEWSGVDPVSSDHVIESADGTSAVRAQWRLGWTSEALYVLATVSDPTPVFVNAANPATMARGDSVGFELGSDPRNVPDNAGLRPSDVFVLLAPVAANSFGAAAAGAIPGPNPSRPNVAVFQRPTAAPGITARAVVGSSGYQVEAEIPWKVLGFVPAPNRLFGFNLDVFDAAGRGTRQSVVSSNPDRKTAQHLPAIWDTLVLKPRG
jgi:hypothetical protein